MQKTTYTETQVRAREKVEAEFLEGYNRPHNQSYDVRDYTDHQCLFPGKGLQSLQSGGEKANRPHVGNVPCADKNIVSDGGRPVSRVDVVGR
jgi:hypothetical protein